MGAHLPLGSQADASRTVDAKRSREGLKDRLLGKPSSPDLAQLSEAGDLTPRLDGATGAPGARDSPATPTQSAAASQTGPDGEGRSRSLRLRLDAAASAVPSLQAALDAAALPSPSPGGGAQGGAAVPGPLLRAPVSELEVEVEVEGLLRELVDEVYLDILLR